MGLFADYLEERRDNLQPNEIDPSMIIGRLRDDRLSAYNRIENDLQELENKSNDPHAQIEFKKELALKTSELEKLKKRYLISEKIILHIQSECKFKSRLVDDLISLLLKQYQDEYKEICLLKHKLEIQIPGIEYPEAFNLNEQEIEPDLLHDIVESLIYYLNAATVMDTSSVRKVVIDCSNIIKMLEHEDYNKPPKLIVSYYLEKTFGMKRTKVVCANCGQAILSSMTYCLNCYERNYEE